MTSLAEVPGGAAALVGTTEIVLITLDTLRHDVAVDAMAAGETPAFAGLLPGGWEERHTPASFTYAAHRAFFAGFLPSPLNSGPHQRPFALAFPGSETTGPDTCVLDAPDVVGGLRDRGYRTICIGGVGFFNPASPLGRDLPGLFEEAHWEPAFGVASPDGFEAQLDRLEEALAVDDHRPCFTFVNVSSIHQPNCHHLPGATADSLATHRAALLYVDRHLPRLLRLVTRRRPALVVVCSDHGTAYGEGGYTGHRVGHPVVWTVPYGEAVLPCRSL